MEEPDADCYSSAMDAEAKPVGNLTPHAASKRLLWGMSMLAVALVAAVVLYETSLSRWWRLALFVPFALAANGVLMGLYRT